MRHLAAAKLQLHPHLIPLVQKSFAMADLGQVIVIVDVNPELDLLQLGSRRFLVLLLLRNVVTEFSEIDDLAGMSQVEMEPKIAGRNVTMTLSPLPAARRKRRFSVPANDVEEVPPDNDDSPAAE